MSFSLINYVQLNPGRTLPVSFTLFIWQNSFLYDLVAQIGNYCFCPFDFEKSKQRMHLMNCRYISKEGVVHQLMHNCNDPITFRHNHFVGLVPERIHQFSDSMECKRVALVDPGRLGTHAPSPPKFLRSHAFFGKNWINTRFVCP